jgi:carnitine-CoA ligase
MGVNQDCGTERRGTVPCSGAVDRTIPALLGAAAAREGGRTWLRSDDLRVSFAAAAAWVAQVAERLAAEGVGRGDLLAMTARNTPEHLVTLLATTALGAIAVPANPASSEAELAGLLAQVSPRALVSDGEPGDIAGGHRVLDVAALADAPPDDAGADPAALEALPPVRPEDAAVLIPTSGTTGRSKLVTQTHLAYVMAGEGFPYWMELRRDDVLMTALPLFHVNAQAYSTMGSLACGAGLVLLPRFSASGFLDAARRHGATEFNAIGAMLEILMRQPERPDDADTPLRLCYTGPAPTRERQEAMERRFGLRIVCGYGLSESPYGLIWPHGRRPFGTLGALRQHPTLGVVNHARVVDEQGDEVPRGQTGELLLRNPVLTPGYWGMPEETARVIVDGWLHTGDLVSEDDDGIYTFVARRKEVIRRRGENLSPLEVEEVLARHPDVVECAVVALPSELSEDEVKAFVVARPGSNMEMRGLRDFAAARLSAFKVPRFWQLLDELPRTPTGRVAKHLLPQGHPDDEVDTEETQ